MRIERRPRLPQGQWKVRGLERLIVSNMEKTMSKIFAAVLVGLMLVGCGKNEPATQRVVVTAPAQRPTDYMSIGMKVEDFPAAFNGAAHENQSGFKIPVITLEKDSNFKFSFNKNMAMVGTFNASDHMMRSITILAQSDGTTDSAARMPILMHDIIRATNSGLPANETARLALTLFQDSVNHMGVVQEDVRNGIRYAALFSNGTGLLFVADQKR